MHTVWVTNKDDHDLHTRWHGRSYVFKIGESVELEYDVAQNIFGYELADKMEFLVRLGWTHSSPDVPAALERLARYEITRERPSLPRAPSPAVGPTPFPVIKRGKGKVGADAA